MKRTTFWIVLMLLIAAAMPIFAGGQQEMEEDGIVTLTIMAPWAEEELAGFQPVMDKFEEQNPGIKLEYRTGRPEDIATILAGQFAVEKTPADVIDTAWAWYIVDQAKKGHLMDVSDVLDASEFMPGALDRVTVDGGIYGASSVGGVTVPEYRKSFFEQHGLTDPKDLENWDEFLALLDDINEIPGVDGAIGTGGGVGWPLTSIIENFILTFGGAEMHGGLTDGSVDWTSNEVRSVLADKLLPLIANGYFGEPDEYDAVLNAMWQGQHGMYIGDSTDSLMTDPAEDRGVFLFPGQEAAVLWYDYWFAPKYTEHPEEAKKLFKFLATEGQALQVVNGGRIATWMNVPNESYPAPEREVFQVIKGKTVLPDMDDTVGGKFQSTIWDQLGLLWANPTEKTLDSILNELQKASEETLAKK